MCSILKSFGHRDKKRRNFQLTIKLTPISLLMTFMNWHICNLLLIPNITHCMSHAVVVSTVCNQPVFCFGYFLDFCAFILNRTAAELNRKWGRERGNDMQQRAAGCNWTRGCCSRDTASVHEAPAPLTELPGCPAISRLRRVKNRSKPAEGIKG